MEIREFQKEYIENILQFMKNLQREDPEELPSTRDLLIEKIHAALQHAESVKIFMVFEGSVPVGYFVVISSYSLEFGGRMIEIDEMYVDKPHRQKGYAKQILAFCEIFAKDNGCVSVYLTTTMSNVYARELYRKYGFSDMQRFFHHKQI